MGSAAAIASIDRVLERHGDEVAAVLLRAARSPLVRDVEPIVGYFPDMFREDEGPEG